MNPKTKKILSYALTIIIGVVVYQLVNHFLFKPPSFETQLMKVAAELNKNCPFMVDSDTRLDNSVGGPGKNFVYNYTLINHAEADINIVELKQNMIPFLTNYIKTSEDMQTFRKEKVTLKYIYKDKSGTFLFSITIAPDDYAR
jgi:hypothetical protein